MVTLASPCFGLAFEKHAHASVSMAPESPDAFNPDALNPDALNPLRNVRR